MPTVNKRHLDKVEKTLTITRYKLKHYAEQMEKHGIMDGAQAEIKSLLKDIDVVRKTSLQVLISSLT